MLHLEKNDSVCLYHKSSVLKRDLQAKRRQFLLVDEAARLFMRRSSWRAILTREAIRYTIDIFELTARVRPMTKLACILLLLILLNLMTLFFFFALNWIIQGPQNQIYNLEMAKNSNLLWWNGQKVKCFCKKNGKKMKFTT